MSVDLLAEAEGIAQRIINHFPDKTADEKAAVAFLSAMEFLWEPVAASTAETRAQQLTHLKLMLQTFISICALLDIPVGEVVRVALEEGEATIAALVEEGRL